MRILELGKFYPPYKGGMETLLKSFCEGFAARGAEVECVVANDARRTVHETPAPRLRVHRLASWGQCLSTSLSPAYPASTRRYRADVWHAHFPNPLADLAVWLGARGVPLLLQYHSDVIRQQGVLRLYAPLLRWVLARATRIVVATPYHIDYSTWLEPLRAKCEVIPFGIDLRRLAPTSALEGAAAALRAPTAGRPILLNIGRLVGYKGQRYLIEAAHRVNAVVWLVGTGPLEPELRALAAELGVADRVVFWGEVGDERLPALLHACDLFVFPSVTPNEAFGLVQVEAMACGKPVICCQLRSGVPYVTLHGETGLVVPPRDTTALADAIQALLADADRRRVLGEAARRRAHGEFEESVMLARFWALFQRVTGAPA